VVEVDRAVCISVHFGTTFILVCFQNIGRANENLYFVPRLNFVSWRFIGGLEDIASCGSFMLLFPEESPRV